MAKNGKELLEEIEALKNNFQNTMQKLSMDYRRKQMEDLYMPHTEYTPEIRLEAEKGLIELRGKSYPENTFEFYRPVLSWIEEYFEANNDAATVVNLEITYCNSSSSKLLYDIFDIIEENGAAAMTRINWIYHEDNESALEAGEDFIEDFQTLSINLVLKGN